MVRSPQSMGHTRPLSPAGGALRAQIEQYQPEIHGTPVQGGREPQIPGPRVPVDIPGGPHGQHLPNVDPIGLQRGPVDPIGAIGGPPIPGPGGFNPQQQARPAMLMAFQNRLGGA